MRSPGREAAIQGVLLGYKQTWAFAFGKFMTDGVWWFFLFWLPAICKAQSRNCDGELLLPCPLAVLYSMPPRSIGGGYFPAVFMNRDGILTQAG